MILSNVYSNLNVLNIPRELYKTKDSNAAFNASSLFFGSSFNRSYKNSIDTYKSDKLAGFANFFASSLDSINSAAKTFSDKNSALNFDFDTSKTSEDSFLNKGTSYFDSEKKASSIVTDFSNFVDDINSFFDQSKDYTNNNVRVLDIQVKNDLLSSKDDLLAFGISMDEDNRLFLDEDQLLKNLDDRDKLQKIASESDSVFNKLENRTEKVLDDSISKYIPILEDTSKNTNYNMYNYLSNSQKFALNNLSSSGSIIDYTF